MTIRAYRLVAGGALAIAAPFVIALSAGAGQAIAGPPCLAWYGSQTDGVCLSYSNGNGVNLGTPGGIYGPNGGVGVGGYNGGVVAGPLLPGRTWTSTGG